MKIFGINFGKTNDTKVPTGAKQEISAEMSDFMNDFKVIKEQLKKKNELIKDNFKKMAESTGNYQNLEHLKKHIENPLNDLKMVRDTILNATKRQEALKNIANKLGIPEAEVIKIATKIQKSTHNLVKVMQHPNLTNERLQSIAKVFNERFKFLEKIKI